MAFTVMLDTSAAIDLLKKGDPAVIKAIDEETPQEVVISAVTRFELDVAAYRDRDQIAGIPCLSATCQAFSRAAEMFSGLRKKGKEPQLKDCFIAACAIDSDAILITRDRDFKEFQEYGLMVKIV